MAKTSIQRRARLRSRATMERYGQARDELLLTPPALSVIAPAAEPQWLLEGLVFQALRTLHFPENGKLAALPGALVIKHLHPAPDRLVAELDPAGAALTIATSLFPETDPDEGDVSCGVPGLRMHDLGVAVEFRRIGQEGAVIFQGVTAAEIMKQHDAGFGPQHADCIVRLCPHELTAAERSTAPGPSPAALLLTSSVVRRLGLLRELDASSIDSWWSRPRRLAVELFIPSLTERDYFDLVEVLASAAFWPRWQYLGPGYHGSTLRPSGAMFQLVGYDVELDLRFQITGGP